MKLLISICNFGFPPAGEITEENWSCWASGGWGWCGTERVVIFVSHFLIPRIRMEVPPLVVVLVVSVDLLRKLAKRSHGFKVVLRSEQ